MRTFVDVPRESLLPLELPARSGIVKGQEWLRLQEEVTLFLLLQFATHYAEHSAAPVSFWQEAIDRGYDGPVALSEKIAYRVQPTWSQDDFLEGAEWDINSEGLTVSTSALGFEELEGEEHYLRMAKQQEAWWLIHEEHSTGWAGPYTVISGRPADFHRDGLLPLSARIEPTSLPELSEWNSRLAGIKSRITYLNAVEVTLAGLDGKDETFLVDITENSLSESVSDRVVKSIKLAFYTFAVREIEMARENGRELEPLFRTHPPFLFLAGTLDAVNKTTFPVCMTEAWAKTAGDSWASSIAAHHCSVHQDAIQTGIEGEETYEGFAAEVTEQIEDELAKWQDSSAAKARQRAMELIDCEVLNRLKNVWPDDLVLPLELYKEQGLVRVRPVPPQESKTTDSIN